MFASIRKAGLSRSAPVSKFVIVASQMSRSSKDRPIDSTRQRSGRSSAQPWRISVSSSYRWNRSKATSGKLGDERPGVERIEADAPRHLFARRLRALAEERAQPVAGLGGAPPVLAHLTRQVLTKLSGADPRAKVVGRIEAGVHVCEVSVAAVADS